MAAGYDSETFLVTDTTQLTRPLIPAIIHQTWKNDTVPEAWRGAQEACKRLHPTYRYMFWTDDSARQLVKDKFPDLLETYDAYPYSIERADAVR